MNETETKKKRLFSRDPEEKINWGYWNPWRIICLLWLAGLAGGFLWMIGYMIIVNEPSTWGSNIKPREGLAIFGGMLFTGVAIFSMAGSDDGQP